MEQGICQQCKKRFERANTGRPKRFCSDRCRLVNHRRMVRAKRGWKVPSELVEERRWVRRVGKRPVTVDGGAASVTDPTTWATLGAVLGSSRGDGIGFVLGAGLACVDLDGALDGEGNVTREAQRVLDLAPNTWVEVSPSGRGLHVWGFLPEGPGRVKSVGGQAVEIYSRARYMTVTGHPFEGSSMRLADLTDFVDMLI